MKKQLVTLFLSLTLGTGVAQAESMRIFTMQGFDDISVGKFSATSMSDDGYISLGLEGRTFSDLAGYNLVDGVIWENQVYLAEAEKSKVLVLDKDGQLLGDYDFDGRLVSGLSVINKQLYVLTSKPAAIFRITKQGTYEGVVDLSEHFGYAWQLVGGPKGQMYLATGEPAAVLQLDAKGNVAQLFQAPQGHFTTIASNPEGTIYVGGSNTGLIYSGKAGEPFKALLRTDYDDVQSLLYHEGQLLALATSGGQAIVDTAAAKEDITGAIYRISANGDSDVLARATGELLLDMAISPEGQLLISTASMPKDQKGQIYSIALEQRKITVVYQSTAQRLIKMISRDNDNWLVVTGGSSRVENVTKKPALSGTYLSEIISAKGLSQFGGVDLDGYVGPGREITVAVRGGLTDNPENGWQEWSQEVPFPGGAVKLEPARFYQLRFTLQAQNDKGARPELYRASISYLRENDRPVAEGVQVVYNTELISAMQKNTMPEGVEEVDTVNITNNNLRKMAAGLDGRDSDEDSEDDAVTQKVHKIPQKGVNTVVWEVSDPAGDKLANTLYYRQEGQEKWQELLKDSPEQYFVLSRSLLADGRYFFKVETSDRPGNTAERAKVSSAVSRVVTIDHHGPELSDLQRIKEKKQCFVTFKAADALSKLGQVSLSINGKPVAEVLPADGFLDSGVETFKAACPYEKGKLSVIIEVEDIFGNRTHSEAIIN